MANGTMPRVGETRGGSNANGEHSQSLYPNGAERLTFGRYKNRLFSDVPTDYLRWCIGNVRGRDLTPVRWELARRWEVAK